MKQILLTFLLPAFIRLAKHFTSREADTSSIRLSLIYVKIIETTRLLFISMVGFGFALMFLLAGLVLLYIVIFVYAPWSDGTKAIIGIVTALIYIGIASTAFYVLFSPSKWLEIFHAKKVLEFLNKPEGRQP